ncbi:MAG: hypothetical protein ACWA5T_07220 [Parvularcula sp.]
MTDKSSTPFGRGTNITFFGVGIFLLIVLWGLWHGIVGPRVIAPTPGEPVPAEAQE